LIDIHFKVTPEQKATIDLRAEENGFDNATTYIKVVALKTQTFKFTSAGASTQEPTIELSFQVTEQQKATLDENIKESNCEEMTDYLQYVALHAVVTSIVEVRSTGNLDSMLQRITDSRRPKNLKKLF